MSIPVDVANLATALADFGPGYLLTAGANGRVKAVTVEPSVVDGVLVVGGAGRGSSANIAANPAVTLLFPPTEPRGFTLLVDGTAELDGDEARVTAASAVLHRPASPRRRPARPPGRVRGRRHVRRRGRVRRRGLRPRLPPGRLTCHFLLPRSRRPVTSGCSDSADPSVPAPEMGPTRHFWPSGVTGRSVRDPRAADLGGGVVRGPLA